MCTGQNSPEQLAKLTIFLVTRSDPTLGRVPRLHSLALCLCTLSHIIHIHVYMYVYVYMYMYTDAVHGQFFEQSTMYTCMYNVSKYIYTYMYVCTCTCTHSHLIHSNQNLHVYK